MFCMKTEKIVSIDHQVVGAVKEVTRRGARLADGKEEQQFDAIILATGYRSNVPSWLKVKTHKKDSLVRFWSV